MRFLLLLALTVAASAPAGAQIVGRHDYGDLQLPAPLTGDSRLPGPGIGRDLSDIDDRVDRARDSGAISRREARRFDRQARLIGALAHRYGRDGLSPWEANELEARARYLRDAVAAARLRSGN